MDPSIYLDSGVSGVRWLIDAAAPRTAELATARDGRDARSACDPAAVAADLADLPELIRERHFPSATGVVGPVALDRAEAAITAHRARIDETRPRTWGDALGSLNDDLRAALRDRHVGIAGAPASRIREAEPRPPREPDAPPVDVSERHGVLCVKVRRFYGDLDADAALEAWSKSGAAQLDHDRIIVDVRGNPGGADHFTLNWLAPVAGPGWQPPGRQKTWYVGEMPLVAWNEPALTEALHGPEALPEWLRAMRRPPGPDARLEIREDAGGEPLDGAWPGRMLVYTDGGTASSGESTAWMLSQALGARLVGARSGGFFEFGNVATYLLPRSGLEIGLASSHTDVGFPVELVGLPVHAGLDPHTPLDDVARDFDEIHARALRT